MPTAALLVLLPVVLATSLGALAQPSEPDLMAHVEQERAAKDSLFRHSQDSPLPEPLRPGFGGLRYFPIDLAYRVVGEIHRYGRPRQVQVPTSTGVTLAMERYGQFHGHLDGIPFSLLVYYNHEDDALVVFFKDRTSGGQTYAGGRYARVQVLPGGRHVLDFNAAYNPYCAYNPEYTCPLPPEQNRLPIAIRAGELAYGARIAH